MSQTSNRVAKYWKEIPVCGVGGSDARWFEEEPLSIISKAESIPTTLHDINLIERLHDVQSRQLKSFQEIVKNLCKNVHYQRGSESAIASASIVVPLTSFSPEPFEVRSPINVVLQGSDGDYTATFFDANIGSSGETQQEAIENLKELLIMSYESLEADEEENLGPQMKKQKAVLDAFMKRS